MACSIYAAIVSRQNAQISAITEPKWGGNSAPFSDPDFDGKEPGEVCRMMGRAQRWLESRGYNIILKGTYTQVRTVKF